MADAPPSSYRDYETEARTLVQRLLGASLERLERGAEQGWPRGDALTAQGGGAAIEEHIKSWEVGEQWKYCIDFLEERDGVLSYAVKWSVPTRRSPVPETTATVFFYLTSRAASEPVLVFYVVEGQRLVHRAGGPQFQAVWLRNVLDNKLVVNEAVCR